MIHGLILYLPAGREKTTCLRLLFLNPKLAQYAAFVYTEEKIEERVDCARLRQSRHSPGTLPPAAAFRAGSNSCADPRDRAAWKRSSAPMAN